MSDEIRILLLEKDISDAETVKFALRQGGLSFTMERVEDGEEFQRRLTEFRPNLVLADYSVPGFNGMAALELARETLPDIPFIFVTGGLGEALAIQTLKSGATDYILKSRLSDLVPAIHRALRETDERTERKHAEERFRESREQLRALSVYLQHVREEERTRISREVHDQLGQALTRVKLDLAWLFGRMRETPSPITERIQAMTKHLDETIDRVRRIATELRPGILDDLGLVAALEWQANEFQNHTGIECSVTSEIDDTSLDAELVTAFFRIFQETLTNVLRHAKASRVEIELRRENSNIVMVVSDNGRGITPAEISHSGSIGLVGMRERAGLLGGSVDFEGKSGQGTKVTVTIPDTTRRSRDAGRGRSVRRRRRAPGRIAKP